jgi:two-component system LytT family response regulator
MAGSPVRAVVVDDEPSARDAVVTLLANHHRIQIVGQATNGVEAVSVVRRAQPDLMFLDVQMPDLDGFGVIQQLGADVPRGVVFVTAHDQHALRAFEVHALDYLLKPYGRPRFDAAVERALGRLDEIDALAMRRTMESMARDRSEPPSPGELVPAAPRRIGVRSGTRTTIVDVADIDWVEASGDYARIHARGRRFVVTERMNALEKLLDQPGFVRAHRSVIVNADRVSAMHRDADGGGSVVLADGVTLRVARSRWDAVMQAIGAVRM